MALISDLLAQRRCLSVELWPPRTPEAAVRLAASLKRLEELHPDFASITYGAAGSTRDRTHDLVVEIHQAGHMTSMAHLVCAAHRRDELSVILERYRAAGIENILALRGDPPLDALGPLPEGELRHAIELVELAKSIGPFCVAVAAHPEGHPDAHDLATDRRHLAAKLEIADLAITQFFFHAADYFRLIDDLAALGIDKPVVPGIMAITNLRTVEKMAELSGTAVPRDITERVAAVADDPVAVRKIGVAIAVELAEELLDFGVPGLHFYTMNQTSATVEICEQLGLIKRP